MLLPRPLFIHLLYTKQQRLPLYSLELTLFFFSALQWCLPHSQHSMHMASELTPDLSLSQSCLSHPPTGVQVHAPPYPSCHHLSQTLSIFHFLFSSHPLPTTVHTAARRTILSHETGGFTSPLTALQPALSDYDPKAFIGLPRPFLLGLSCLPGCCSSLLSRFQFSQYARCFSYFLSRSLKKLLLFPHQQPSLFSSPLLHICWLLLFLQVLEERSLPLGSLL